MSLKPSKTQGQTLLTIRKKILNNLDFLYKISNKYKIILSMNRNLITGIHNNSLLFEIDLITMKVKTYEQNFISLNKQMYNVLFNIKKEIHYLYMYNAEFKTYSSCLAMEIGEKIYIHSKLGIIMFYYKNNEYIKELLDLDKHYKLISRKTRYKPSIIINLLLKMTNGKKDKEYTKNFKGDIDYDQETKGLQ